MIKKGVIMKKKIMFVDDETDVVESVKSILKKGGYGVVTAYSGKECLKKLEYEKVDLILLDIMMPELDGWDVCAKIKENKKTEKIPVIFLTAKTDSISKGVGRLASADYIEKPFDIKDLLKRIDIVIKKKK